MKKFTPILFVILLFLVTALPAAAQSVTASLTAQNTYSNPITTRTWVATHRIDYGTLNVSVSGTFVATWFIQRSFNGGTTWLDVASYTSGQEKVIVDYGTGVLYRVGVKTGGFTSGTLTVRLDN